MNKVISWRDAPGGYDVWRTVCGPSTWK